MPDFKKVRRSDLKFGDELGRGGFSTVYHAIWTLVTSASSKEVAAKKLNAVESGELNIMSKLDHTHIIKLLGVVDEAPDFFLILELCKGGTLRQYLDQVQAERLPFDQFVDWAKQAASPIEYLRRKGVVHKDIKSPNYLIADGNILKLCDFGISKEIETTMSNASQSGSYPWMAPELLKQLKLSPNYDIFSLGIVLWELWTTCSPYKGFEWQLIIMKVCRENERPQIPDDCPKAIADLMRTCWKSDWKIRPSIVSILSVIAEEAAALTTSRQRPILYGSWISEREIKDNQPGTLVWPFCIAVNTNADTIVIADGGYGKVHVYNMDFERKFSLDTSDGVEPGIQASPREIIFSSDGTCYVTISNWYVLMYDGTDGTYKGKWAAVSPEGKLSDTEDAKLSGLTMDKMGQVLVGEVKNKYISFHKHNGRHVATIKVEIEPKSLAVTSRDEIIISDWRALVHLIDVRGQLLYTIKSPHWLPTGVTCYADIICICNFYAKVIHRFSVRGEYLGHMPISITGNPTHGVFMADGKRLLIVSYGFNPPVKAAVYRLMT